MEEKLVAFETKHGFEGVISATNICRKCACGQPTIRLSEFQCVKCGGERRFREQCYLPGCGNIADRENGTMCSRCWVVEDHVTRGCPVCETYPKNQSRPDGKCSNCVTKMNRATKRDAMAPLLAQLCVDEGIDEGPPDAKTADPKTRYAVLNKQDDWKPHVVVRKGNGWQKACAIRECPKMVMNGPGTPNTHCRTHGGGHRCAVPGAHYTEEDEARGFAPWAGYTLSENASMNNYPKPEWVGMRTCMDCLRRLDPTHIAVKVHVQKEHLVISAIAQLMHERGQSALVLKLVNDCASGPSRRRADLSLRVSERFLLDFENDEHQHKERTTSCERKKLAGYLADHGAPAYTDAEGKLWDPPHPTDEALDLLEGTPGDTPAMDRLRMDRKRATQRVLRDYAAAKRGLDRGEVIAPKLHVVRFNCDAFVSADGTKRGGLFASADATATDDVIKLKPTKAFAPAIKAAVDRLLELCALEADDDWFESRPEMSVEYFRYDGCTSSGTDPEGAVAKRHAARAATDTESVPLHPQHTRNREGKKRKIEAPPVDLDSDSESD